MKFTRNMKDKFFVFYLQFINSLEGLGMFFSSAALIRRLRKYTATHIILESANERSPNISSFTFYRKKKVHFFMRFHLNSKQSLPLELNSRKQNLNSISITFCFK